MSKNYVRHKKTGEETRTTHTVYYDDWFDRCLLNAKAERISASKFKMNGWEADPVISIDIIWKSRNLANGDDK